MSLKLKNRRHRPLYKKFILLRKNIQNRRRLSLLKFRKKKWKNLISYLKRSQLRRKKNFLMYDINRYFLPKRFNSFKRKFSYILQTKKKFKLFYVNLSKSYIKTQIKLVYNQKNNDLNCNSIFLNLIESRLDVTLYRSHFALSIRKARQLILHEHINVNGITVKDCSFSLTKSDLITVNDNGYETVEFSLVNCHLWPLPPKYLIINYKTLQILFNNDNLNYNTFSTLFPFWLDLSTILKSYR